MTKTTTTNLLSLLLITTLANTISSTTHPRITITNDTPLQATVICQDDSAPLTTYDGFVTLNTTTPSYKITITHLSSTSTCTAYWNTHYFVTWEAFSPKRDGRVERVFWSLRRGGVYYSGDRKKWKLVAAWGSG